MNENLIIPRPPVAYFILYFASEGYRLDIFTYYFFFFNFPLKISDQGQKQSSLLWHAKLQASCQFPINGFHTIAPPPCSRSYSSAVMQL